MRWSKVLNVVECHAGGEIGKVVTGGIGDIPGETELCQVGYDPSDPFPAGYTLSDTWLNATARGPAR
jgi:proline racemase